MPGGGVDTAVAAVSLAAADMEGSTDAQWCIGVTSANWYYARRKVH